MEYGAQQPPLFEIDHVPKLEYQLDIITLFNEANKQRLRILHAEGIPYAIYSGAHVAYMVPGSERPIGDMDVMIPPESYDRVHSLRNMRGGQAYAIRPLEFTEENPVEATFLMVGGMEIKADSDGTPGGGYFTLTDLVRCHCITIEQEDTETGETFRATFAHPLETILFKAAMWRKKDQRDIRNLLIAGISFDDEDQRYLWARIDETGVGEHVMLRLRQLGILRERPNGRQ